MFVPCNAVGVVLFAMVTYLITKLMHQQTQKQVLDVHLGNLGTALSKLQHDIIVYRPTNLNVCKNLIRTDHKMPEEVNIW